MLCVPWVARHTSVERWLCSTGGGGVPVQWVVAMAVHSIWRLCEAAIQVIAHRLTWILNVVVVGPWVLNVVLHVILVVVVHVEWVIDLLLVLVCPLSLQGTLVRAIGWSLVRAVSHHTSFRQVKHAVLIWVFLGWHFILYSSIHGHDHSVWFVWGYIGHVLVVVPVVGNLWFFCLRLSVGEVEEVVVHSSYLVVVVILCVLCRVKSYCVITTHVVLSPSHVLAFWLLEVRVCFRVCCLLVELLNGLQLHSPPHLVVIHPFGIDHSAAMLLQAADAAVVELWEP